MKRAHALLLALLLGAAVVAATFAAVTTTSLGTNAKASTPAVSSAQIAARNAKLDETEAALRHALKKKPPALPKLPQRVASKPHVVRVSTSRPAAQPVVAAPSAPTSTQSSSVSGGESEPGDDGGGGDD
jgi:hypothetical protein